MRFYFDTSVWLAYLARPPEFFHREAKMWFDRVRDKDELFSSRLISTEIRNKKPFLFKNYLDLLAHLERARRLHYLKTHGKEEQEAAKLSAKTGFYKNDLLHVLVAKRRNCICVSADYMHWPMICRLLDVHLFRIADIHTF